MWPSAVMLSRWLISNSNKIFPKYAHTVLELGSGCGLTGLCAAKLANSTQSQIILTDFNDMVLKNLNQNIILNDCESTASVSKLDFYAQTADLGGWIDGDGNIRSKVDIIIAADVICKRSDSLALAQTISNCLVSENGFAYIVCANAAHRFGVEYFVTDCTNLGMHVKANQVADFCSKELLIEEHSSSSCLGGLELTTGYVSGMEMTLFVITRT
mmetsp:Transcript_25896/g.26307  ORF Transcript_25896/g.26307 Transcript_25896/m.26307 type:complete len:214 (-) Transcript_25896:1393-2034(-)